MDWPYDDTIALIKQYKKHECLWNVEAKEYRTLSKKKDAWHNIGRKLSKSAEEVERKIRSLLSSYRREKKKVFESKQSETDPDKIYKSRWFGYKHMMFLQDINRPAKTRDKIMNQNSQIDADDGDDIEEEEGNGENLADNIRSNEIEVVAIEQVDDFPVTLVPPKKRKILNLNHTDKANDIEFTTVKSVMEERQVDQRDEYSAFGEVVAHKLRKLKTDAECNMAQFKITEILFEASMGHFRQLYQTNIPSRYPSSHTVSVPSSTSVHYQNYSEPSGSRQIYLSDENFNDDCP